MKILPKLIIPLLTLLLTACGGGSSGVGGSVTGSSQISISQVGIDTNSNTTPIGNTDYPFIDRSSVDSGNYSVSWYTDYAAYYAKIKIGINSNYDSTANHFIFNGQCSSQNLGVTGCQSPPGGGSVTLPCHYDNNNSMWCGSSNMPKANLALTQQSANGNPIYLFIKICGDMTDFTCTSPQTIRAVIQ